MAHATSGMLLSRRAGLLLGVLLIASCEATTLVYEGEPFLIRSSNLVFEKVPGGYFLTATGFGVFARGKKYCGVKIERILDSNNNGVVGDQGDRITLESYSSGEFTKYERSSLTLSVPSGVDRGYIRIRGKVCPGKKGPGGEEQVLAVFEVSQGGFRNLPPGLPSGGEGVAFATSAERPHYLSLGALGERKRTLQIEVGDLTLGPAPLRSAYTGIGALPAKPDFLGALLVIEEQHLFFLPGPGKALARIPFQGRLKIGKLRVLSFDSKLQVVGSWFLENLAF